MPVVGTADAEIKVLSADNLELLQIPDLSPGVGQNIYIQKCWLICVPWCIQLYFFQALFQHKMTCVLNGESDF